MKLSAFLLSICGSSFLLLAETRNALPSDRIAELLISRDKDKQATGVKLLENGRQQILAGLLAELGDSDAKVVEAAAFELGVLFSPWAQGRDASRRFIQFTDIYDFRRPVERPSSIAEAPVIREALMRSFTRLREKAEAEPKKFFDFHDTLRCVASTLNEYADDHVVDWAVEELANMKSPYLAE